MGTSSFWVSGSFDIYLADLVRPKTVFSTKARSKVFLVDLLLFGCMHFGDAADADPDLLGTSFLGQRHSQHWGVDDVPPKR